MGIDTYRAYSFRTAARILFSIVLFAAILLPISCGQRPVGYGVLLWSHEEDSLATGSVIPIRERSERQGTVVIELPDAGGPVQLPTWRLRIFSDRPEADAFAAQYEGSKNLYARSLRNALPVRETPDRLSRRVYKLAEGEVMKVLERASGEVTDEAGFRGFWYRVLTREGIEGYSFDYYLSLYDPSAPQSSDSTATAQGEDPAIEKFLSNIWRPENFRSMIDEKTVNLQFLRSDYGIFPDPSAEKLVVNLPGHRAEFPLGQITRTRQGTYLLDGSSFQFSVYNNFAISVQYTYNGRQFSSVFIILEEDVEEVISREVERREALYTELLTQGQSLASSAYGVIQFQKDRRFVWKGYERLVPGTIPREATGSGRVEFSRFLDRAIADTYDGVLSLHFDGTPEYRLIDFLYSVEPGGVKLSALSDTDIEHDVVKSPGIAPLIIYFSYRQEQ